MPRPDQPGFVSLSIPTEDGKFTATYSGDGLVALDFPEKATAKKSSNSGTAHTKTQVGRWHRQTIAALKRVLNGREPQALPPLDVSAGTGFQRRVWNELLRINPGRTRSYGEIARAIGSPKAVRAVGGACGANPIPVLIPCHRVLAANRKIGGFSGGMDWKRKLLACEGVMVSE